MRNPIPLNSQLNRLSLLALFAAACALPMQAQAPTAPATKPIPAPANKFAHPHKHPPTPPPPAVAVSSPPLAVAPPLPVWPVNEAPLRATISWDSQGLTINAANSSLQQILADVTALTGTSVEGFGSDQRVFGDFGPGPVREVVSQLLLGSGYNVVMTGDQGQGTPRQILLSLPNTTGAVANNAPSSNADEDVEPPEQAPPMPLPTAIHPGYMGHGVRNAQQLEVQRQFDAQQQGRPQQ